MKTVLVVAAHADDETLGCGGAIYRHFQEGDQVFCLVLTEGESARERANPESRKQQFCEAAKVLGIKGHRYLDYRDNALDSYPLLEIVKAIEAYKAEVAPDIVYTHHSSDLNIDHQITHEAALTAFRGLPGEKATKFLTFQVPSSAEWSSHRRQSSFAPNYFVELGKECAQKKLEALQCYRGEILDFPHPRSSEAIEARLKVAGSKAGVLWAEEFFCERFIHRIVS